MLLPEISTSMENYLKMFSAGISPFVYQLCESCRYLNSAVGIPFLGRGVGTRYSN